MKIAVISTVWFPLSHADVIVTRWVRPFFTDADCGWARPASAIASVYIEQRPLNDIGVAFCAENGIPLFETVEQALTLGSGDLAVDGVLLIAEHGDYPRNEYGQKLYPRKRLFDEIVSAFRASGRTVPVFNDKHFSWDFAEACEMVATAKELGFPLYGGSSLTHCPSDSHPSVEVGDDIREAVVLFHGDPDDYGFHSLEFAQRVLEKRGETGIRAVRAMEGEAARKAVVEGEVSWDLLLRALVQHGYPDEESVISFVMARVEGLVLFQFEHMDGLRVTHLLMPKFVSNWIAAIRLGNREVRSCHVEGGKGGTDFFNNFAWLNARLESFFQTGRPPSPPERTLLVSGALQSSLQALKEEGRWVQTPHLAIVY